MNNRFMNPWTILGISACILLGCKGKKDPLSAPCWRYQTAWQILQNASGIFSENQAVGLLQQVSLSVTRWSALYNLKTGALQLVMGRNYQNPYTFSVF